MENALVTLLWRDTIGRHHIILRTHVFCDYWSLDLDDMVIDIIKHYIPRP